MPTALTNPADAPNLMAAFDTAKLVPEIFTKEIELKTRELGFTRFRDFLVVKEDLTKTPGDQLHIPKVADLRNAQTLTQTSVLRGSGQDILGSSVTLTPTEFGDELQMTQYANITSQADLIDLALELLARQALKTENFVARDRMFNSAANRRYAGAVTARTSVTADLAAADIDYVVERLEKNEALKWPGETFIGFIHPYAKTDIIQDLVGVASYQAAIGGQLYAGEVGMYNRTRFIETAYAPMVAWSAAGLTGNTGGVTIAVATAYTLYGPLCEAEVITFTYASSGDKWTAPSGTKSGARTMARFTTTQNPNDPTVTPLESGQIEFTDSEFTANDIALEVKDEDGIVIGYDVIITAAAVSGAASPGTFTLTVKVNTQSSVFGQRHLCWGVIRPITILGVELFDYGRVKGIAWNAFWDCQWLHKNYGYVIEAGNL